MEKTATENTSNPLKRPHGPARLLTVSIATKSTLRTMTELMKTLQSFAAASPCTGTSSISYTRARSRRYCVFRDASYIEHPVRSMRESHSSTIVGERRAKVEGNRRRAVGSAKRLADAGPATSCRGRRACRPSFRRRRCRDWGTFWQAPSCCSDRRRGSARRVSRG